MPHRRLIPWFICLIFIINGCAGKRINTEPKPTNKQEEKRDPIKLDVRPQVIMATPNTATIQLTIVIDPNPENKYIEWSWISPAGKSGSSGRTIDGGSQKKFQVFIDLSPGEYEIWATVYRSNDESFTVKSKANVIGEGSPF